MRITSCHKTPAAGLMVVIILLGAAFLSVSSESVLADQYRPPNPVLDYVPQNIGIYDTYYSEFQTVDCRWCHGDRNAGAQRHQFAASAFAACPDGCQLSPPGCLTACHPDPDNPDTITSDCVTANCHPTVDADGGGGPHHQTDLAGSGQCTACHRPDLLVETGSIKPLSYFPTAYTNTPTPYNCENCHWPTNCDEVLPDRLDPLGTTDDVGRVVTSLSPNCADDAVLFQSDWSTWPHPDPPATPAPIMANSLVHYGTLNPSKPYMATTGTHHEILGNPYPQCSFCHAANPDSPLRIDSTLPESVLHIRYCQNCHSAESLHGIQEHMQTNNIYTVGGVLNQQVTDSDKCVACHGETPATAPVLGPKPPVVMGMSPVYGPGGTTVCTITGENFGPSGDVLLAPKMVGAGQAYRISSGDCTWSDNSIGFTVPSELTPNNYNVRVETSNKLSNFRVFTLTGTPDCISCPAQAPVINTVEPTLGTPGAIVTVNGQDFGEYAVDRKVQMQVEWPPGEIHWEDVFIYSWTQNEIRFFLRGTSFWPALPYASQIRVQTEKGQSNTEAFDVRKAPEISILNHSAPDGLTLDGVGFYAQRQGVRPDGYGWESSVILASPDDTVSVDPANINSWSNWQIQLTMPELTPAFYGVSIETVYFYDTDGNSQYTLGVDQVHQIVTSDPVLLQLISAPIIDKIRGIKEPGKRIRIIGSGFGDTQGDSILHLGERALDSSKRRIKLWSDTMIKIKLPDYPCSWFMGDVRRLKVWVTVNDVDSNVKKPRILKPESCP
jgi:hypothetical protein